MLRKRKYRKEEFEFIRVIIDNDNCCSECYMSTTDGICKFHGGDKDKLFWFCANLDDTLSVLSDGSLKFRYIIKKR